MFSPEMAPPTCTAPTVLAQAVVRYESSSAVFIEFDNLGPQNPVLRLYSAAQPQTPTPVTPQGNTLTLTNLASNTFYELKGLDDCGVLMTLTTINTTPHIPGDPIIASDRLYSALTAYVANETQTTALEDYLEALPGVNGYEKSAFAQQYFLQGAPLPATFVGTYPASYVKTAVDWQNNNRGGENPCICNFILNQSAIAIPDQTVGDFDIALHGTSDQGAHNSNSKWWYVWSAKGPAKYHQLWSDGFRAGSNNHTKELSFTSTGLSDNKSPFFARLSYHLLCVNYPDRLPEDCGCTKTVRVNFGYDAEVQARAVVLGGLWEKRASAAAQDWAVALVTHDKVNSLNDVQILDAGLNTAQAKCSGGYPISLITDALGIVYSVAQVVVSIKSGGVQSAASGIQDLTTKIGNVLQTVFKEHDCDQVTSLNNLLQGTAAITFEPNDPVSIVLMSGSKLTVKGKRAWQSHGRVLSSFHLTGVLMGGNPSPTTQHCCTDYTGNWAYESYLNDLSSRQIQVNQHLHQNGPGQWQTVNGVPNPGGQANAFTDLGFSIGKLLESNACQRNIPIYPGLR
ncbi:MAG: hypothetical protein JNK89_08500, partial [Saprospiraceae bacterium]|nr:hypothetical protein [Saprospiraceae bacterium]